MADFGRCCSCGGRDQVNNIVCHSKRAPVPGTGWGCVVCGLDMDGAISVVCDRCVAQQSTINEVCQGFPTSGKRLPLESLSSEVFEHHCELHEEEDLYGTA